MRLLTFGGLSLTGHDALTGGATRFRPKSLALLAVIAAARTGVARDVLAALFWAESDSERARNALNQTLFVLRRDLKAPELLLGGSALRLNESVLTADVADFQTAIGAGDQERAAGLYVGDFLHGVHLRNAPEFERWCDGERQRFHRSATQAFVAVASKAEANGSPASAAEWWGRLAEVEPTSTRATLGLMRAFAARGDSGAALRQAAAHSALLAADEIPPDPQVLAAGRTLRQPTTPLGRMPEPDQLARHAPPSPVRHLDAAFGDVVVAESPSAVSKIAERSVGDEGSSDGAPGSVAWIPAAPLLTSELSRGALVLAAVAVIVTAGVIAAETRASRTAVSADRIAVFPFQTSGLESEALPGDGLAELFSTAIDGVAGLHPVDDAALRGQLGPDSLARVAGIPRARAIAQHFGASLYVMASAVVAGQHVRLTADLRDVDAGGAAPLRRATVEGRADSAASLLTHLAADLLSDRVGGANASIIRDASRGTASLPALRAFLAGESAFRERHYGDAADAFERAVTADSAFAMAYYRLSIADDWANRGTKSTRAAAQALALSRRLSTHDSLKVAGLDAWRRGDADNAELLYRAVTAAYPFDTEAWYQLGEVLFHSNPWRGRSVSDARPAFERVLAAEPSDPEAVVHLARIAAVDGRIADLDSLTRLETRLAAPGDTLTSLAVLAVASGDEAGRARIVAALRDREQLDVYNLVWRVAIYTDSLAAAEQFTAPLLSSNHPGPTRAFGFGIRALLRMAQGKQRDAFADVDSAGAFLPGWALELRGMFAGLPFTTLPAATRKLILDSLLASPPRHDPAVSTWVTVYVPADVQPVTSVYEAGVLAASLGTSAHLALVQRAFQMLERTSDCRLCAASRGSIDGMVQAARGEVAAGVAHLASPPSLLSAVQLQRYLRAEYAVALGHSDDATRDFNSFEQTDLVGLMFAAPAHARRGDLLRQRGSIVEAAQEYRRAQALWRNADADLRAVVRRE